MRAEESYRSRTVAYGTEQHFSRQLLVTRYSRIVRSVLEMHEFLRQRLACTSYRQQRAGQ